MGFIPHVFNSLIKIHILKISSNRNPEPPSKYSSIPDTQANGHSGHPARSTSIPRPPWPGPAPLQARVGCCSARRRPRRAAGTHLIIWGTVTLEFSSNAFIMSPLHRMLSTHWKQRGDPRVSLGLCPGTQASRSSAS